MNEVLLRINNGDDSVYTRIELSGKHVLEAATIARAYLLKEFGWDWSNKLIVIENDISRGPIDFNAMESINAMDCLMSTGYTDIFEYPVTYDKWRGQKKQLRENLFQIGKIYILKNPSLRAFKCSILVKEPSLQFKKIFIAEDESAVKTLVNQYVELLSYVFRKTVIQVNDWEEDSSDIAGALGRNIAELQGFVFAESFEDARDWRVDGIGEPNTMFLDLPRCFGFDEARSISFLLIKKIYGSSPSMPDIGACGLKTTIPRTGVSAFTFDTIRNIFSPDPTWSIHHIFFEGAFYNYYGENAPVGFKEVPVIPLSEQIHAFPEIENIPIYWEMNWYDGHNPSVWGITDRYQYPYHEDDDLERIKKVMILEIAGYVKEGWIYRGMTITRMSNPKNLIPRVEIPITEAKQRKKIMAIFPSEGLTPERIAEVRAAMIAAAEALTYQEFELVDEIPLGCKTLYRYIKDLSEVIDGLDCIVGFNFTYDDNAFYHELMMAITINYSNKLNVIRLPWIEEIIPELWHKGDRKNENK